MSGDPGALFLVLLRWSHAAAQLSLFGGLLFLVAVAPAARRADAECAAMLDRRLERLARTAAGLALLLGAAWYAAETAAIAGVTSAPAIIGFLPVIGLHTQFGHWLALRLLLLAAALALPYVGRLRWFALALAAAAVAIQPALGHAGASDGAMAGLLIAGEAAHLLAAGAWLGALLPLCLCLWSLPAPLAAALCARFSLVGMLAVGLIAASGVAIAVPMVGGVSGLVHSTYGWLLLLKTGLFLLALGLAALNRFVLTGWLVGPAHRGTAKWALLASIAAETTIGLAILLSAAFLASAMPGADLPHHAHAGGAALANHDLWRPLAFALAALAAAGIGVGAALLRACRGDRAASGPFGHLTKGRNV